MRSEIESQGKNNPQLPRGEPGGLRLKPKTRDRDSRLYMHAMHNQWISKPEEAESVRARIANIAITSPDHRAAVQAATWLVNTDQAVIQSNIIANASQTVQNSAGPTPEPIDPE